MMTHTHAHTHARTHTNAHAHTRAKKKKNTHTHTRMSTRARTHTRTHVRARTQARAHTHHPPPTSRAGPILTLGHHIHKLGRGPQGDAAYQISKLYAIQFQRRRILKMNFFVPVFRIVSPRGWASFEPRGIIWTNLVEVHKEKLYSKYKSSRPSSFREEF